MVIYSGRNQFGINAIVVAADEENRTNTGGGRYVSKKERLRKMK
jgi:hypothetical protein